MKADPTKVTQLTENVTELLINEKGRVGNLQVTGKLVKVPPIGEAIVIGDLHGDLGSLEHILEDTKFISKAEASEKILLIFLGDYGDRGTQSSEVYYIVLKLKEMFPNQVILLRGNHEGPDDLLPYPHDLPILLSRKFSTDGSKIYGKIRELFKQMYNAVFVEEKIVMLHGGAPSQISSIDDLAFAHESHPQKTHLEEILWSDPIEGVNGTLTSPRGAGKLFGEDITRKLQKLSSTNVLVRGHEPAENGFKMNHSDRVLTLFSRRGPPYHNSCGAYLRVALSRKIEDTTQLLKNIHKF